jgi:transposase
MVHQVIASYKHAGVAAIETPGKGGRRRQYLTLQQERAFLQPFLERAARGEHTTAVEIQLAFEAVIGHHVNKSTLYRLLARHGLQHLTGAAARRTPAQADQSGGEEVSSLQERRQQPPTGRLRSRELAPRRY